MTSGVFGLVAQGCLIAGVSYMLASRTEHSGLVDLLFKSNNVAIIFQSLFMIPVVWGLHTLARERLPGTTSASLALAVVSLSLVVLCALLFLLKVVADDLYLVPQGAFGVWLMLANRRLSRVLPRGLTQFGTVVGFGLVLVGIFPLAYAVFVDPIGLQGPVPLDHPNPETTANTIIHLVFYVGTLLGVVTYPIWAILLGRHWARARAL
jgi:hypothetical protein